MTTPYYQDEFVTLYHGDAHDFLPDMDAELLLTDPPYVGLSGGYRRSFDGVAKAIGPSNAMGDEWRADLEWADLLPESLIGAVVFCSHHSIPEIATASAFRFWRRVALLTWWKRNAPPTGKNVPRFRSEFAWVFARIPGIGWDGIDDTVFDIPNLPAGCFASAERTGHPTQKPIALLTRILAMTKPASVVDPFAGSGTTLVAAKGLNIKAIGSEREERYCEMAAMRLSQNVLDLGGAA